MKQTPSARKNEPVDIARESVAGEEDPGASIDTTVAPQHDGKPGDTAPPGAPGTGENVCPRCGGIGRVPQGRCPDCAGTGKVTAGIGGG